MATYVRIEQSEFDEWMQAHDFFCLNEDQVRQELVYVKTWHDETYMIKVFSSIVPGSGTGRAVGKDAIRVVLFVLVAGEYHPFWKAKRVHRVQGWKSNLIHRISDAEIMGLYGQTQYNCPVCESPLVGRDGRRGPFIGCTNWSVTRCGYTRDMRKR